MNKESNVLDVEKRDGELYVVLPKKPVKIFFKDDIITDEDRKNYDIVQFDFSRSSRGKRNEKEV